MNARSATSLHGGYLGAVHETYVALKNVFASPDVAGTLRSATYWSLLALGDSRTGLGPTSGYVAHKASSRAQVENRAIAIEIDGQIQAFARVRAELEALKMLAARPGLPVVYDTNMLNHWQQPDQIKWRDVFRAAGERVPLTRLVVPLRVVDELDRQKYGEGDLARKAATAIRFLERVLNGVAPGEQVQLRDGVVLEIWVNTDSRDVDADLAILHCAADLDGLHPGAGVRVLTDDVGMRLRAQQMNLKVMTLPASHRKPGTAIGAAPPNVP